jgi:hypothetical protein
MTKRLMAQRNRTCAAGLAVAALVLGVAYLYGGFLAWHWVFLAPLAAAGLAAAYWHGVRLSRSTTAARRLASGMLAAAAFAALTVLPAGIRWASLAREMQTLPIPPDAIVLRRDVYVPKWTSPGQSPYNVEYVTGLSFGEADRFLREGFAGGGWKLGRRSPISVFSPGEHKRVLLLMADQFGRRPATDVAKIRHYTLVGSRRWARVILFDAGNERWICFNAESDPPPDALRNLTW